jgi:arginine utilization regulatory protein
MYSLSIENLTRGLDGVDILSQIFNEFGQGVTIADAEGKILYYNRAQGLIDNIDPESVVGKSLLEIHRVGEDTTHPFVMASVTRRPLINHACYYNTPEGKLVNSIQNVFSIVKDGVAVGCVSIVNEFGKVLESYNLPQGGERGDELGDEKGDEKGDKKEEREHTEAFPQEISINSVITKEKSMLSGLDIINKSADSLSPLLIRGEIGSGKDLLARVAHLSSARRENPYLSLNCSSIPENILEGLLFGTVRGAFTAAVDRPGLFELADGGTLFLDEINAIPPGLQLKIARTLRESKVRRVGSSNGEKEFSLKLISGVSVDPKEAVSGGRLNPELLLRLGVVMVSIPPLRERKSDIPLLTSHFIQIMNERLGKKVEALSDDLKEPFSNYSWPGNVRELENVIEGAMNLTSPEETLLRTQHFAATLLSDFLNGTRNPDSFKEKKDAETRPVHFLHRPAEAERIAAALEAAGGNAAKAARSLKISPQLMNYKLKKFSLKKKITVHVE